MTIFVRLLLGSYLAQAAVAVPDAVAPAPAAQPEETQAAVPPSAPPPNSQLVPSTVNQPAAVPQVYPPAPSYPPPYPTAPYYDPAAPDYRSPALPSAPTSAAYGPAPVAALVSPRPRFGVLLGGGYVPHFNISGFAAGATAIPFSTNGFETRFMLVGYRVENDNSHSTGALAMVEEMKWWGFFGLGIGAGTGYTVYHSNGYTLYPNLPGGGSGAENFPGRDSGSEQVIGYLAPATFRFGSGPWLELGIVAGLTESFAESPTPLGYVYAAVLF